MYNVWVRYYFIYLVFILIFAKEDKSNQNRSKMTTTAKKKSLTKYMVMIAVALV